MDNDDDYIDSSTLVSDEESQSTLPQKQKVVIKHKYLLRERKQKIHDIPFDISSIKDLITLAETGHNYRNINTRMLWNILPQLIEIDNMIGMNELKQTMFYQIIYYLQELSIGDENIYLHTVITGEPGCGKCLGEDTPLLMYDGSIKKVQDIQVNDLLMGDDSTPRTIQSVCTGTDALYRVAYDTGEYIANSWHILCLRHTETDAVVEIPINEYILQSNDWKRIHRGYRTSVSFPVSSSTPFPLDPYITGYVYIASYQDYDCNGLFIHDNSPVMTYIQPFDIISNKPENAIYAIDANYFAQFPELLENKMPPSLLFTTRRNLQYLFAGIIDAVYTMNKSPTISHQHTQLHFSQQNMHILDTCLHICNILGIRYATTAQEYTCSFKTATAEHDTNYSSVILHLYDIQSIPSLYWDAVPETSQQCDIPIITTYTIDVQQTTAQGTYYGFELDGNGRFLLRDTTVSHNTTIASIIGEMYKNMGVLSPNGVFKIAKREDFVAEYLGQTAVKTKKLLQSCIGGVLFIDEVYALGPGKKDTDSFSKEAIDTLNVFLSENCDSFCCIIAGYEEEVRNCFFAVNKGLNRRFQWVHRIGKYTTDELISIFHKLVSNSEWISNIDVQLFRKTIDQNPSLFKCYGGDIENLFTKCKMAHARRIVSLRIQNKFYLTNDDFLQGINLMKPNTIQANESIQNSITHLSMYM